jgi:cysteinyl-tRNA synthetase
MSNLPEGGKTNNGYKERFLGYINDDIDTPKAVALIWELLKAGDVLDADKRTTILDFDRILGLNLGTVVKVEEEKIPDEIFALAEAREEARKARDWVKADALRKEIESRGYDVLDTENGFELREK